MHIPCIFVGRLFAVKNKPGSPLSLTSWWRHQMETFSALLAICAGNSPVPGEFPTQRPVTRSFDVFFDLHPNKRLSKQWWGCWFETPPCPLRRHRNVISAVAGSSDKWLWLVNPKSMNPGYFTLAATDLKPQQMPMFLHIRTEGLYVKTTII